MPKPLTQDALRPPTSSTSHAEPQPVPSPCIQVCRLDAMDVCEGCHRSREEITLWTRMTAGEQQAVLERCRVRSLEFAQHETAPVAG